MSSSNDDHSKQALACLSSLGGRIVISTVAHPFEFAKFLIQIGHEPITPYPAKVFWWKQAYVLPNVFKYVKYIGSIDGISGCYRGFTPKITSHIVAVYASHCMADKFKHVNNYNLDDDQLTVEEKRSQFVQTLSRDVACKTASIIASHPFHVIALRCMAQFVGGEETYSGLFGSIGEIYREQGISGFFAGIVPRWVGEVSSLIVASTVTFIITTYLIEDSQMKPFTGPVVQFIVNGLTYPFTVVSSCMAVNNCGLVAGLPPNMPIYSDWKDCWRHLSRNSQLNRGSSLLWRFHRGPMGSINFGSGRALDTY